MKDDRHDDNRGNLMQLPLTIICNHGEVYLTQMPEMVLHAQLFAYRFQYTAFDVVDHAS